MPYRSDNAKWRCWRGIPNVVGQKKIGDRAASCSTTGRIKLRSTLVEKIWARILRKAEGTDLYAEACKQCSDGIYAQYLKYVERVHWKLKKLPHASKKWWKLSHKVLQKPDTSSRIPPLCRKDNTWAMDEQEKADTFATCFCDKCILPVMEYVEDSTYIGDAIDYFVFVRPN